MDHSSGLVFRRPQAASHRRAVVYFCSAVLRSLRELLWRDFRADLLIIVSILLIICGASWGLMRWQLNRVQNLLETQDTLQLEIAEAQTALDQLQAQTWGVWLHEEDGMRYVVLPRGTLDEDWPLTVDGQPAIRLSSE